MRLSAHAVSVLVSISFASVACGDARAERRAPAPPAALAPYAPAPSAAPPLAAPPATPLATAPLFTGTTRALVVGLLDFADPALTDFSPVDRRDVAIARTLVERGVPAPQVVTLLDAAATREAVLRALAAAADATPVGGTLIVYYAGHGTRTSDGDVAYVAYDTRSGDADTTGVSVSALYGTLAPRVVGKRVLFFADCCHSGALSGLAQRLSSLGAVAASVTSADASNTSTGNWTFSQVLLEGLRGDACLDADTDGTVGLEELEAGVREAMRYREGQRSGAFLGPLHRGLAIGTRVGAPRSGALAGRFMTAPSGEVVRVSREDGTTAEVRAYDYAGYRDYRLAFAALRPIPSTRYPVGAELMVEWGGRTWPAVVTAADGDFAFITYPGWPSYWDEWILADRVRQVVRLPAVAR